MSLQLLSRVEIGLRTQLFEFLDRLVTAFGFEYSMEVVFVNRPPRDFVHPGIVVETLFITVHKIQPIRCFPDSLGVAHPRTMEPHGAFIKESIAVILAAKFNESVQREYTVLEILTSRFFFSHAFFMQK